MVNIQTKDGNMTVNFTYTAPTVKMTELLNEVADEVIEKRGLQNVELTNQQKMELIDGFVKQVLLDIGNIRKRQKKEIEVRDEVIRQLNATQVDMYEL
jgi:hypothetical protein